MKRAIFLWDGFWKVINEGGWELSLVCLIGTVALIGCYWSALFPAEKD
jgi:hypothetical protein